MRATCLVSARGLLAGGRLRGGSLCTGYGGLDLAVMAVLDIALAWCADSDRHASAVLAARFPGVPNLGDLTRVDWAAVPTVDLVTAGFPGQDISTAGRGAGIGKGTRSGLWTYIAEGLRCLRPGYVSLHQDISGISRCDAFRGRSRGSADEKPWSAHDVRQCLPWGVQVSGLMRSSRVTETGRGLPC